MFQSKRNPWLELSSVEVVINKKKVLNGIDLNLYLRENTLILGPNGSGKSLLVRLISRSLYPVVKQGSYLRIFGSEKINLWSLRSRVGILSTELEVRANPYSKAKDIIISGFFGSIGIGKNHKPSNSQIKMVSSLINKLDLSKFSESYFGELSDGQKRRILIARALIHDPDILILDEPTNGLDIKATSQLLKILNGLSKDGKTILMITHKVEEIVEEIDRVIFLADGKIVGDGAVKQMITSDNLSKLFNFHVMVNEFNGHYSLSEKKFR